MRGRMGLFFLVEVQAGDSPWMDFFLPCYASYKHKPIPKPPRSTHSNKSAGLSHLVLIRVPGWEWCWLSQMRTFASRLAGVSLSLAVLRLHPHMRCTSAGFASLPAAAPLATYGKGRVRWVTHRFALLSPSRSFQTST